MTARKEEYQKYTSDGTKVVVARSCNLTAILGGMDDANDITVTIYDNAAAASGSSPIGTTVFKADYQGMQGFTGGNFPMNNGIVAVISGIGSGWVTIKWNYDMCF